MISFDVAEYILSLEEVTVDTQIDPKLTVYKTLVNGEYKIFALILNNSNPVQVTLKCDRQLAKKLRAEYETVMPADKMSKNYWNKILCTGQIPPEELKDLVNLSYFIVKDKIGN